ncbi:MAG: hypothetical protein JXR90_15895 [Spirochaetes bacterium]|nr:hypothetical protein [Spirochaetota bacterium]
MGAIDFSKITKEHIEKAIADIDQNGVKNTEQSRKRQFPNRLSPVRIF